VFTPLHHFPVVRQAKGGNTGILWRFFIVVRILNFVSHKAKQLRMMKAKTQERNLSIQDSDGEGFLNPADIQGVSEEMNIRKNTDQGNEIIPVKTNMEERYLLRLADGQGWEIIAAEGVGPWVEKLASIMQLKNCEPNGYPKLIFIRKSSRADWRRHPVSKLGWNSSGDLADKGWKTHDLESLQLWAHSDVPDVICEMGDNEDHDLDIVRMWLSLSPVYNRALESGGLPLHAALVERNGTGVLLAAPGGTGKSTCCRRIPHPWKALSDDLVLIVVDTHKQYQAHPFPTWSNYLWEFSEKLSEATWDIQHHLPLSAIFFLEQSITDEVIPVGKGQASVLVTESAVQVYQSIWRNLLQEEERRFKKKIFENACELAKGIPAFKLRVSMNGRFWEEMERILF
jgi:SynChlorMet cassette protein ScmC